jgi:membrane protease YdiL (CAAX protease family)
VSDEQTGRLALYLVMTFGITWVCWWPLAFLIPAGAGVFSNATFSSLYIAGGLGPTLAALLAVAFTPREGSLAAYATSLTRWRVPIGWYLVALLLPAVLAVTLELLAARFGAQAAVFPAFHDLTRLPLIFSTMILGGGLEELGWRGVAQPMLERRLHRLASAAIVGVAWAVWHVPLFFIHGVPQYGANFPLFAADVVGNAFLLALIYGGTGSILVCVLFHAASNTSATMGLGAWDGSPQMAWIGPAVKIALGTALILWLARVRRPRAPSPREAPLP